MGEDDKKIKERSDRMIKLFKSAKGMDLSKFPIPAFSKWLNGKVVSVKRGEIVMEFEIRSDMTNPSGILHGGVQCAFMDDTIGAMTATLGYKGILIATGLHADYLGKARVGEKVRVKARMVREGRKIVHAISEITNENDDLITKGSSNLLKTQFTPEFVKYVDDKASKEFKTQI